MTLQGKRDSIFASARTGFAIIVAIIVMSYGLFFYLETSAEFQIRGIQFERSKDNQVVITEGIANRLESSVELATTKFRVMASEIEEIGDSAQLSARLDQIESLYVDRLHSGLAAMLDKDGAIVWLGGGGNNNGSGKSGYYGWNVGNNLSQYSWVQKTKDALAPVFTGEHAPGNNNIDLLVMTHPLVQHGQYRGQLVQFLPAGPVAQDVGQNLPEAQALSVLDLDGKFVLSSDESLLHQQFFSSEQGLNTVGGESEDLRNAVDAGLRGDTNPQRVLYRVDGEEMLTVGVPVTEGAAASNNAPVYYLLVTTPVSFFYKEINQVLVAQRLQAFSILAGTSVSVIILAVFVNRAASLDREVRRRTSELQASNTLITQQKKELEKANEDLKQLDRMKDEFLNIAAHELRTPITPILMAAEELEDELGKRSDVRMIARNAKKLQRLVQNVLDLARIENNTFKLAKEPANLGEVVYATVEDYRAQLEDKAGSAIVYDMTDVPMNLDKTRIMQVLSNLLGNAIKFTKQGTVTVSVTKDAAAGKVTVAVRDTGKGIDPEIMPRLFQKFATKSDSGTGLGLYISKSIVEAHGGTMWAENNADGAGGATFYFTLPLAQ
ncbi:signal transduction histidine kinase [Candidatus Nitrososphaera evergladensis SR1]|uniref:histidine kinase n=1 Tax=Candidatus Nitrososphaera evergladensis SR1 TaxID=1459636 RepID=A0A075MY59_9ARCH|nr:HAMP domain-containing sensor histidine kinase [Candidatus Nitrososphaera evergladensis]AIF84209.1 signal transduction histidine kinase [Candidatus Nitrososphaera evergladensis SR1]